MQNNKSFVLFGFCILAVMPIQYLNAEISTLFTTQPERQIIDSNRYRTQEVVEQKATTVETPKIQQLVQEEVTKTYTVTGIALAADGNHMVWINQQVYDNGEEMDDSSSIQVMTGDSVQVEITAPDGQKYYATSGETVDISYMTTADQ